MGKDLPGVCQRGVPKRKGGREGYQWTNPGSCLRLEPLPVPLVQPMRNRDAYGGDEGAVQGHW